MWFSPFEITLFTRGLYCKAFTIGLTIFLYAEKLPSNSKIYKQKSNSRSVKHNKNFGFCLYLGKFLSRYYSVPYILPKKVRCANHQIPKFWQISSTNRKREHLKPVSTPWYWLLVLHERHCGVHLWRFSQLNWTQPFITCLSGLYMNMQTPEPQPSLSDSVTIAQDPY